MYQMFVNMISFGISQQRKKMHSQKDLFKNGLNRRMWLKGKCCPAFFLTVVTLLSHCVVLRLMTSFFIGTNLEYFLDVLVASFFSSFIMTIEIMLILPDCAFIDACALAVLFPSHKREFNQVNIKGSLS